MTAPPPVDDRVPLLAAALWGFAFPLVAVSGIAGVPPLDRVGASPTGIEVWDPASDTWTSVRRAPEPASQQPPIAPIAREPGADESISLGDGRAVESGGDVAYGGITLSIYDGHAWGRAVHVPIGQLQEGLPLPDGAIAVLDDGPDSDGEYRAHLWMYARGAGWARAGLPVGGSLWSLPEGRAAYFATDPVVQGWVYRRGGWQPAAPIPAAHDLGDVGQATGGRIVVSGGQPTRRLVAWRVVALAVWAAAVVGMLALVIRARGRLGLSRVLAAAGAAAVPLLPMLALAAWWFVMSGFPRGD